MENLTSFIEGQRENLNALREGTAVSGGTSDYEQLENLPTLNGETIIGDMVIEKEHAEIKKQPSVSNYTPMELVTLSTTKILTYEGVPIVSGGYDIISHAFSFTVLLVQSGGLAVRANCTVNENKSITLASVQKLATKDYVDGKTTDWSDIQNKPETFTPSAHTHAYSEITDTPDLSGYATKDYVDTLVGNADTLLGTGVIE